jgi:hypothetical protein
VLVARVLADGVVLLQGLARAVCSATAELSVERVEGLAVDAANLEVTE